LIRQPPRPTPLYSSAASDVYKRQVYLHVVLGEMVPKNLAVAGPDRAVLLFGPPLVWIARGVAPVIQALNWTANGVLRLFGFEPKDEVASAFTASEVQSIVEL